MTLHKILRALAILSYFLIFVDGEYIGGPMVLLMLVSISETDLLSQIIVASAFLGLIGLMVLTLFKKNYWTFFIEAVVCVLLTLPIINGLQDDSSRLFHYPMFVIPTICFLLFYLLSLYFSYGAEPKYLSVKKRS
jgi:hypothetical protein